MSVKLTIGGEDNYTIGEFDISDTDKNLSIENNDTEGTIIFKLGSAIGTTSKFQIVDSSDNSIEEVTADKNVTYKGSVNIHGSLSVSKMEYIRFSSTTFGNDKTKEQVLSARVLYSLLNLVDLCGYTGILKINRLRCYITDYSTTATYVLQAAIYRLNSGATFGNLTTYNNSTLISITDTVYWTETIGFIEFTFSNTLEISQFTDGVENRYFLAILPSTGDNSDNGGSILQMYGTQYAGNLSHSRNNYFYFSDTFSLSLDSNMIEDRWTGLHAPFPYFDLLYQQYTRNSWVKENGQKYYIDSKGRKYLLLIRQQVEKDIDGNPQSAAGWPDASVSLILSGNKYPTYTTLYNDPETTAQFLNMNIEFDEYRDTEGKLEFKEEWPGIEIDYPYNWNPGYPFEFEDSEGNVTDYMTWKQTVTPLDGDPSTIDTRVLMGYKAIDEGINYAIQNSAWASVTFIGTRKSNTSKTYNDGVSGNPWWFAIGAWRLHNQGLPIFTPVNNNADKIIAKKANLWLRVPDPRDVYILAGESNMIGLGVVASLPVEYAGITQTDVKFWLNGQTAWVDMTPGSSGAGANNFGPEISFGKEAAPCHIMKYGVAFSDLDNDWNSSSGTEYTNLLSRLTTSLETTMTKWYRIRGMLWLQGESDAEVARDANDYQTNLTNFISAIRKHVSLPKMPFIIAKIYAPNATYSSTVRDAQQAVADADPYTGIFDTNDLTLLDSTHYDTDSQITIGIRFHTTLSTINDNIYQVN